MMYYITNENEENGGSGVNGNGVGNGGNGSNSGNGNAGLSIQTKVIPSLAKCKATNTAPPMQWGMYGR